jgi:hypothetical protein
MAGRRRFGRIRKMPSDRWQVRYCTPDGREHTGPASFAECGGRRWKRRPLSTSPLTTCERRTPRESSMRVAA